MRRDERDVRAAREVLEDGLPGCDALDGVRPAEKLVQEEEARWLLLGRADEREDAAPLAEVIARSVREALAPADRRGDVELWRFPGSAIAAKRDRSQSGRRPSGFGSARAARTRRRGRRERVQNTAR